MLNGLRRRLSYGSVMSTVAVFGVLAGGSAYAASKIGPNDIKPNAVRSTHIKNGEVKTPDLAGGAVTAAKLADGMESLQGSPGPKGDQGDPGPQGEPGETGPRGPSNVYARFKNEVADLPDAFDSYGTFNFGREAIVTLPLPAGSFHIQAKGFANGEAGNVGCVLVAGPNFDASLATLPGDGTVEPLVMQVLHHFSEPDQAELRCTDYGESVRGLYYVKVDATQVESFSNPPTP